jgi:site-specific recombinase XerD
MGNRNHSLGSRSMRKAGIFAIRMMMMSFSSVATMTSRWLQFCDWCEAHGYKTMEAVSRDVLLTYGRLLAARVNNGELSTATAQNYVSVVNRIFEFARKDREVWASPTTDCDIPKRCGIAKKNKGISLEEHTDICDQLDDRLAILLRLQRDFGLRFSESCKLNAKIALQQAIHHNQITVYRGTKGGRKRIIDLRHSHQIETLKNAAEVQGRDRSMIPKELTYIIFKRKCYRTLREHGVRFHGERHSYAQLRYRELTGVSCPIEASIEHGKPHIQYISDTLGIGLKHAKSLDRYARLQIANELGHNRIKVSNAYLG